MADFGISEAMTAMSAISSIAGMGTKVAGIGQTSAGTDIAVAGQLQAADDVEASGPLQRAAYDFQAAQLRRNAGQQVAAAQRKGIEDETSAHLMASKLIAAAGASGGTGPQINRLVADILTKGSYNKGMDVYNGEESSRQMLMGADAAAYQGYLTELGTSQKARALRTSAEATRVSGNAALLRGAGDLAVSAGTLFGKYGAGGPKAGGGNGGGIDLPEEEFGAFGWDH